MLDALAIQLRVLKGLILREFAAEFGRRGYGILFTFGQPMMQSGIIATLRLIVGAPAYGGMEIFPFTVCGVLYFYAFSQMNQSMMTALVANRGLLYFHHVMELDIYLAKFFVSLTINLITGVVFYVIMRLAGFASEPDQPLYLILLLIVCNIFGFGYGLTVASLALIVPYLQGFNKIMNRILYFTSGIFFAVPELPPGLRHWLLYNPLLHMTEWSRSFYFAQYDTAYGSLEYAAKFIVGFLVAGLLLERLFRDRLMR